MADPKKHLEIERKYDAESDFALPDLTGLPGVSAVSEPQTHLLVANYFDTDDLRLAAHGITLRRRRGGDDAGWHLKMPVGPDSKNELRAALGRPQVVPARLAALVAAHTRGATLRPVATLETNRTVVRLLGGDGEVLAEVADDAVIGQVIDAVVTGDGERPESGAASISAWREIEVELGTGSADLLKSTGRRLRKAGARKAGSSSKLGRVLRPVMEARGGDRRSAPAPAAGTAGAAVAGYLAAQLEAVLTYDPKARLAEFDAVHKMRVAVRRLRSALKSYAPVVDRKRTDPLQPELKWLADALGEVRDLEVLRMRFADRFHELAGLPGFDAEITGAQSWMEALAKEEQAAYRRLNATLKQPRYYELLDALDALVADPPLTEGAGRPAAKELPRLVSREWKRLKKSYDAIEVAEDRDEARHATRRTAKRTRYAADLAAAELEKGQAEIAARTAAHAKSMQEVLGGFQDGVIAMEHLRAAADRVSSPSESFVLGVLYGVERCEALSSLSHVEDTWAKTSAPGF